MENLKEEQVKCPCGHIGTLETYKPFGELLYDVAGYTCPKCERRPSHCNEKSGEVYEWMTLRDVAEADEWMRRSEMDVDWRETWLAEEEY